jgi:enoyl-CoA hydratase/carnithine racemase
MTGRRRVANFSRYEASGGIAENLEAQGRALRTCFESEDHQEGVAALLERRPAKFVGR